MKIKPQNKETKKKEDVDTLKVVALTEEKRNVSPTCFCTKRIPMVPSSFVGVVEWLISRKPNRLTIDEYVLRETLRTGDMNSIFTLRRITDPMGKMKSCLDEWMKVMGIQQVEMICTSDIKFRANNIEENTSDKFIVTIEETPTSLLYFQQKRAAMVGSQSAEMFKKENKSYSRCFNCYKKINDKNSQTTLAIQISKCCGTLNSLFVDKNTMATPSDLHDSHELHKHCNFSNIKPVTSQDSTVTITHCPNSHIDLTAQLKHYNKYLDINDLDSDDDSELTEARQMVSVLESEEFYRIATVVMRVIERDNYCNHQTEIKMGIPMDPLETKGRMEYSIHHLRVSRFLKNWGMPVTSVCINPRNNLLFAVSHGQFFADQPGYFGRVNIWNHKNATFPEKSIDFKHSVTSISFSTHYPYVLLISFINGTVTIVNITGRTPTIIMTNKPDFLNPVWQVQWIKKDHRTEVPVCCGSDGLVSWFNMSHFKREQILLLSRKEGSMKGIKVPKQKCNQMKLNKRPDIYCLGINPSDSTKYLVGTDEGSIHLCSTDYWNCHSEGFQGHHGPVHHIKFHPDTPKVFLSVGIDYCVRVWAEFIYEPIITISTQDDYIEDADWSPQNPTIIVTIAGCHLSVWDIHRISTTVPCTTVQSPTGSRFTCVKFLNGSTVITGDAYGDIHFWELGQLPFSPNCKPVALANSIKRVLTGNNDMLEELRKLGYPFDVEE